MALTICVDNNGMNYDKLHKTPNMLDLFSKTKSLTSFVPHWQIMAFLCHAMHEAKTVDDLWIYKTRSLLKTAAESNIFTASSFIEDNYKLSSFNNRIREHLESTPQGLMALNMMPRHPASTKMFEQNIKHILAPCYEYIKRSEFVKSTFYPHRLLKDICDQKDVVINIRETIISITSLDLKHDEIIFSLLAWIMSSISSKNTELDIYLSSDLSIGQIPIDLRIQMAINGINLHTAESI